MEYDVDVYLLSSKFINDYPLSKYPELMYKHGRPYSCLLIDTTTTLSVFLTAHPLTTKTLLRLTELSAQDIPAPDWIIQKLSLSKITITLIPKRRLLIRMNTKKR